MIISVKVKSNSKKPEVKIQENIYIVKVDAQPIEGKANERLIEILSDFFKVRKSNIRIKTGHTSKNKIIEIES